ncbi:MAG: hypothetical protein Tsb0013_21090 [Phycisphaerales bacterium]
MAKKPQKKSPAKTSPINGGAVVRALVGEGMEAAWRVGTAVVVLGLIVAWVMGRAPLKEAAARGHDLTPAFVFAPTDGADASMRGVPPEIVASLEQLVLTGWSTDPFDRAQLLRVRDTLLASGWFASIEQVRRLPDGVLEIACVWREPRAEVHPRRGSPVLVGNDSAPMRVPADLSAGGVVKILNPLEGPPRTGDGRVAFGSRWGLSDVSDAIALLNLLAERGLERTYVDSIDVRDPSRMLITTTNGAQIVWGGPVDARSPGEASVEDRLGLLSSMLRDPAFNRPGPVLDIRTGQASRDVRPGS